MLTAQFGLIAEKVKVEDYELSKWKYQKKVLEKANLYM